MLNKSRNPGCSSRASHWAACERRGNNLKGFKDFRGENGSSQGQSLALTVFYVPDSLDSRQGETRLCGSLLLRGSLKGSQSLSNSVSKTVNRRDSRTAAAKQGGMKRPSPEACEGASGANSRGYPQPSTKPSKWHQIALSRSLICTGALWNSAACGTNRGNDLPPL